MTAPNVGAVIIFIIFTIFIFLVPGEEKNSGVFWV